MARRSRNGSDPQGVGFVGRETERERIIRAIVEDRSHVVLFGERGRGKTSLANQIMQRTQTADFAVARYVCSATSDFDSIMRGLFQDMPHWLRSQRLDGSDATGPTGLLPAHPLQPVDILTACHALIDLRILLVVDEFDRITDQNTRTAIADTIKHLSDRGVPLLFLIIGVSGDAEELLGRHPSIQRCITRIALPLLTPAQVERLVERGAEQAGLDFSAAARSCIAALARGVPYTAQLLSLRAGQAALDHGRTVIQGSDLVAAMEAAVVEAEPRILVLYDTITNAERDVAALAVMRAAAAGAQDELGRFRVRHTGTMLQVAGMRVDAAAWRRVLEAGAIQAVRGEGPDLYAFADAMLPQLVLLRAVLTQRQAAWMALSDHDRV